MVWKLSLTQPDLGEEEIAAVGEVLRAGWLTQGQVTERFERVFAAKMNVEYAFAVNNCTAALHLANIALGITAGDEVICPALTFVATANASRYTGADVVFAGVCSEDDLTISPEDIEARISPRTKAVSVMHYAGFPCRMDSILDVARRHGLFVIEDCAHSPFAWTISGGERKYAGAIGDIGCFSFFGNKNMTTGEGGMITTNNPALAERIRLLRSHAMTTLTYQRHQGHASGYDVVDLGYNYRFDEIRSAIGLCQLSKIDRLNALRRQVYLWYAKALADCPDVKVPFVTRPIHGAVCHIASILVRRRHYAHLAETLRNAGIQTSKHYELIPNLSLYRQNHEIMQLFPDYELMTLPLAPQMTREDVCMVANTIYSIVAAPLPIA